MSLNFYQKEIIKRMLIFEQNPVIKIDKKFNSEDELNKEMYKHMKNYYKSIDHKYKCNVKMNCGILKLNVGAGKTRTVLSYLNYINRNKNKIKYIDTIGSKTVLYDDVLDIIFSYLSYDFIFDISQHWNTKFIDNDNIRNNNFTNDIYSTAEHEYYPNYNIYSWDNYEYLRHSYHISNKKVVRFTVLCKENLENYHLYVNDFRRGREHIKFEKITYEKYSNVNLIIVPYKLVSQWKSEAEVLNTECFIISRKRDFDNVFEFIEENKRKDKYVNVIINSNMVCHFYEVHKFIHFNKIIIDEPDSIKIKKSLGNLSCDFMWLISATIERFNEKGYGFKGSHISKSISYIINEGIHNKITITYDKNIIQEHMKDYTKDIEITHIQNEHIPPLIDCYLRLYNMAETVFVKESLATIIDNHNNGFLRKYLSDFIKTKSLTYIPSNHSIEKLTYYTRIRNINRFEKYETYLKYFITNNDVVNLDFLYLILISIHLLYTKNFRSEVIEIANNQRNIRDILIFYQLIKDIYNQFNLSQCNYHKYLYKKYIKLIENTAVRTYTPNGYGFTNPILHSFKEEYRILPNWNQTIIKTKYDILLDILQEYKPTLIFNNINSQSKYTFDLLNEQNIKSRILKGNTNTINKILREYNGNKLNVLLLNSRNSGSGLNLTHTQNIIIMDNCSKETEEQIVGRVKRYNQESDCIIYKLSPLSQE